jgi:predicted metal-binding protein
MESKYVVIIQCEISRQRCSGFACTKSFYDKTDAFQGYGEDTKYIAIPCGGCCGAGLAVKLEHFSNKLLKKTDLKKDDVTVHLSSCMTTDNYHHDRCPHFDYIKGLVKKKGYHNIVEGTYISRTSEKKRADGIYKSY